MVICGIGTLLRVWWCVAAAGFIRATSAVTQRASPIGETERLRTNKSFRRLKCARGYYAYHLLNSRTFAKRDAWILMVHLDKRYVLSVFTIDNRGTGFGVQG